MAGRVSRITYIFQLYDYRLLADLVSSVFAATSGIVTPMFPVLTSRFIGAS